MNFTLISMVVHSQWYDGFVDGSYFEVGSIDLFLAAIIIYSILFVRFGFMGQGSLRCLIWTSAAAMGSMVLLSLLSWRHVPDYQDDYRRQKLAEVWQPLVYGAIVSSTMVAMATLVSRLKSSRDGASLQT